MGEPAAFQRTPYLAARHIEARRILRKTDRSSRGGSMQLFIALSPRALPWPHALRPTDRQTHAYVW
jgi:hypothetical protein